MNFLEWREKKMIKCEKGEVFITGLASDAIADWAALTVHMVSHLERRAKESKKKSQWKKQLK